MRGVRASLPGTRMSVAALSASQLPKAPPGGGRSPTNMRGAGSPRQDLEGRCPRSSSESLSGPLPPADKKVGQIEKAAEGFQIDCGRGSHSGAPGGGEAHFPFFSNRPRGPHLENVTGGPWSWGDSGAARPAPGNLQGEAVVVAACQSPGSSWRGRRKLSWSEACTSSGGSGSVVLTWQRAQPFLTVPSEAGVLLNGLHHAGRSSGAGRGRGSCVGK